MTALVALAKPGYAAAMELDLLFFALAIPAVIFAGMSKGGFGSGAAFASTPLLALIVPPGQALGLMLPLLMLADVAALKPYWRRWDPRAAWLLVLAGLPGVALGALLYRAADPDVFRLLIGVIAVGFVLWQAARARGLIPISRRPLGPVAGSVLGATAGFTSFVSHAGGPPVAVYLLTQGISKTAYQATTVIVFWAVNIFKAVPYAFLGIFTAETLLADLLLAPFILLGTWLGVKAHHALSERAFFAVTYVLLIVTGSKLIWDALT